MRTQRSIFPAKYCALSVLIFSLLTITGYAFIVRPFIGYVQFIPMVLHTAVCFSLLSLGLFYAFPSRGLMNTLTSLHTGGMIARKLLPLAILLPIVLGWLRLQGEQADWYQTEFGTALFATLITPVFSVVIWWVAISLNRVDEKRQRAAKALEAKTKSSTGILPHRSTFSSIVDTDRYFRRLNPQWEKTIGYTLSELEGKRFLDFVHPDDLQATFAAIATLSNSKAEGEAEELPMGHGETVLVIDDETSILKITKSMLESYGYNVLTAADGAEGVVVCMKHASEIRAIVCDMNMPLMDGPATIRAVRKILPDVKVIAVSGYMSDERAAHLDDGLKMQFLQKPYPTEKLLKV